MSTVNCGHENHECIGWGYYERTIVTVLLFVPLLKQIRVHRFYCKVCGCTFGVLPEGVLPRVKWTTTFIQFVLGMEYYSKSLRLYNGLKFGSAIFSTRTVWKVIIEYGYKAREYLVTQDFDFSGVICIDEKWLKCNGDWCYGIVARDPISGVIVWVDVLHGGSKRANRWKKRTIKRFLRDLKKLVEPKVVVTDMDPAYPEAIEKVFPETRHQWCLYHVEKAVYRAFKNEFGKNVPDKIAQIRNQILDTVYNAKSHDAGLKRFELLLKQVEGVLKGEALGCLVKLKWNTHRLFVYLDAGKLGLNEIPRTNNSMEHTFADVRPIYLPKKSFRSDEGALTWLSGFAVWRNHAVYGRGKWAGSSPLGSESINDWFDALDLPPLI